MFNLWYYFILYTVSAANFSANLSIIPVLTGTNFKSWKENVMIVLGCMDLDLALRKDQPPALTEESSTEDKRNFELWEKSNRMSVMIMKRSIPEVMRGSLPNEKNAKDFLAALEKLYLKNEKGEMISTLGKLISMRYSGKGNIREHILQMSHLAGKLKEFKLEINEDLLVALVLLSLPNQYGNLQTIYNGQKDKWNINELIAICIQEEEKIKAERPESANLTTTSKAKKRKIDKVKEAAGVPPVKAQKKQDEECCFFYGKSGHLKKECVKYKT